MKEIPLPSGVFARIDRVTLLSKLRANNVAKKNEGSYPELDYAALFITALVSEVATFDGEKKSFEQVLDLDGRDGDALCTLLVDYMKGPIK